MTVFLPRVAADVTLTNSSWLRLVCSLSPPVAYLVTQRLLPEEPRSRRLMTSDQDTKVVAEPQVQQVQEAKENSHLVSLVCKHSCFSVELYISLRCFRCSHLLGLLQFNAFPLCRACERKQSFCGSQLLLNWRAKREVDLGFWSGNRDLKNQAHFFGSVGHTKARLLMLSSQNCWAQKFTCKCKQTWLCTWQQLEQCWGQWLQ